MSECKHMAKRNIIIALVLGLALAGCTHNSTRDDLAASESLNILKDKALSQASAEWRARQVSDVKYNLETTVNDSGDTFSGIQNIQFQLAGKAKSLVAEDLMVDFQGGEIHSLILNGEKLTKIERGPLFVRLPAGQLKVGFNTVEIHFTHEYSHTGAGLHRFEDHEDHNIYLYTKFEPFDANRWAPFFDQPDIKAPLKLSVVAPSKWQVIANYTEISKKSEDGPVKDMVRWDFRETAPISTYLYALVAGPYVSFEGHYKTVKTRLWARRSFAKYVDSKEWLKITEQGLRFYEGYFGMPYPFEKYDQIIVPEFNAGAMENVGAVTFTERLVKRGGATRNERAITANVILHEMAHQWFGDLVTMKWWNDLWLNESFATVMASISEVGGTEYTEGWSLLHSRKIDALWQDLSVVTHPISGRIRNTNEAYTNFDNITYGKGAAVLQELYHYVGDEQFRLALQFYFKTYAYKNTTLADFAGAFEVATKKDLKKWFADWLTTTGVDEIEVSYSCKPEVYRVDIRNLGKTPRTHSLKIGRYNFKDGKVISDGASDFQGVADKEGSIEIHSQQPYTCPDMIYANVDDQAYVKVRLDPKSIEFLKAHLSQVSDVLLRQSIWGDLWNMVRDQKMKLADFSSMALQALQYETDSDVLKMIAAHTIGDGRHDFDSVSYFWPRTTEDDRRHYEDQKRNYSQVLWSRASSTPVGSDLNRLFVDLYLRSVGENAQAERLTKMLGTLQDEDRRWEAIVAFCRIGSDSCEKLIEKELKRDHSDSALKFALSSRVVRPDLASKKDYLERISTDASEFSFDENRRVTRNLFPLMQREALAPFADEIYKSLQTVWLTKRDEPFQADLAWTLAPVYCDSLANAKLDSMLRKEGLSWPATVRKPLLEKWDEDSRCIAVRKYNQ